MSYNYGTRAAFRLVHNMTLINALRYVVFVSTLVEMQHDARIDSDPRLRSYLLDLTY